MQTVAIIGAGQAAAQVALSLRKYGFGGRVVMFGDEPWSPYQRPPLSKAYLSGALPVQSLALKADACFEEAGVELVLDTPVRRIDRAGRRIETGRGAEHYDALVLATGGRARKLGVSGESLEGVFTLRGIADADNLRPRLKPGAHVVICGGGYIGLEVAAVAVGQGCEVTVVELADRVLSRVAPPPISKFYEHEHRANGVTMITGRRIVAFRGGDVLEAVETDSGALIDADVALVAAGLIPNVELAEAAGLPCSNGIVVDAAGRTDDAAIYAAGDVASQFRAELGRSTRVESVQNAIWQGKAVAASIAGAPAPSPEVAWFWSDQYDIKLQIAGLGGPEDHVQLRGDPAERRFSVVHLHHGRITSVSAVNHPGEFMSGKRLIGTGARVQPDLVANASIPLKQSADTA